MRFPRLPGSRLAAILVALSLAACGTAVPSGTPAPTSSPTPALGPTGSPPVASSGPVEIDPSLLDHLPAKVDGLDVMRSPGSDQAVVADPVVIEFGEGVVTALAIDPAAGDFAYATLVRLRPGAFSEELFRGWRDSFDAGVCERAGGVAHNAEATIGGHTTYIGTCAQGVRTYHVWLGNSRVLVSVSALGERRLGELLVEGLRD